MFLDWNMMNAIYLKQLNNVAYLRHAAYGGEIIGFYRSIIPNGIWFLLKIATPISYNPNTHPRRTIRLKTIIRNGKNDIFYTKSI